MMTNSRVARNAVVIIAAILSAYALFWMRTILTPLALALFLLAMVDGLAREIAHRAPLVPKVLALPLALAGSVLVGGLVVYAVAANAASFAQELLNDTARLNQIIARIAGLFGVKVPPTLNQLINQLNPVSYMGRVASALQSFASGGVAVLIYLGFLIASRQGFQRKAIALFPVRSERAGATEVFDRIRDSLQRYLWIQTVTGLMIAALSAAVMYGVGLSNALFWSFLILVLSFVPVIGGAIGSTLPPAVRAGAVPHHHPRGGAADRAAGDRLRGRQRGPAAHAARQPEHRPGGGAAQPDAVGRALGSAGHVPVHAADGDHHHHPRPVRGLALDRDPALRRRGPAGRLPAGPHRRRRPPRRRGPRPRASSPRVGRIRRRA